MHARTRDPTRLLLRARAPPERLPALAGNNADCAVASPASILGARSKLSLPMLPYSLTRDSARKSPASPLVRASHMRRLLSYRETAPLSPSLVVPALHPARHPFSSGENHDLLARRRHALCPRVLACLPGLPRERPFEWCACSMRMKPLASVFFPLCSASHRRPTPTRRGAKTHHTMAFCERTCERERVLVPCRCAACAMPLQCSRTLATLLLTLARAAIQEELDIHRAAR